MGLKADIQAITHSPADKIASAGKGFDLDSLRLNVVSKIDELNAAQAQYNAALPAAHAGKATLATTSATHL